MSAIKLAALRASLLPSSSVERVQLDSLGYDARGKYWGKGLPLYRLTDLDAEFDYYGRFRSELQAVQKMHECMTLFIARFAYWSAQLDMRTPRHTALDWDAACSRRAIIDVCGIL